MRDPSDHDLIAYVLGRLDGPARERVERALARDEALDRRHREIRGHLRLYDGIETPPPPPFAGIAARLEDHPPRVGAWPVWAAAALVALLLAGVALLGVGDRPHAPLGRAGEGVYVARDGMRLVPEGGRLDRGDVLEADEPAELALGAHVRVVLDGGTRLVLAGEEDVRLERGRAFFEVSRGPFAVITKAGTVRVIGTVFEVALVDGALEVAVASGRVEAAGSILEAGQALSGGRVAPLRASPGAFFRRPVLRLASTAAEPVPGSPVALVFTFGNEGRIALDLAGPDGVRAALWLEVVTPDGEVHDLPVPAEGALAAGRTLHLAPHEEVSFTVRVPGPFGDPGTYRCRALYRPEGQPPLVSDALLLEVR